MFSVLQTKAQGLFTTAHIKQVTREKCNSLCTMRFMSAPYGWPVEIQSGVWAALEQYQNLCLHFHLSYQTYMTCFPQISPQLNWIKCKLWNKTSHFSFPFLTQDPLTTVEDIVPTYRQDQSGSVVVPEAPESCSSSPLKNARSKIWFLLFNRNWKTFVHPSADEVSVAHHVLQKRVLHHAPYNIHWSRLISSPYQEHLILTLMCLKPC